MGKLFSSLCTLQTDERGTAKRPFGRLCMKTQTTQPNSPITDYEIIDHGIDHSQYFQGCGVSYTRFENVVTGCGSSADEAWNDALEQMACNGADISGIESSEDNTHYTSDAAKAADVESFVRSQGEEITDDCELYYYLSIRWNDTK